MIATEHDRATRPRAPALRMAAGTCLVLAMLALPFVCGAQGLARLDVIMRPFDAVGDVDPELVESLHQRLAQSIERNSDYRIAAGGSAYYYLKGTILPDARRQTVTLQLFKAKTDRVLWIRNYDYRDTSVDRMAGDVIEALSSVTSYDTWN